MAKNICIKLYVPPPPKQTEEFSPDDMTEAMRLMSEHGWSFKFSKKNILARKYPTG